MIYIELIKYKLSSSVTILRGGAMTRVDFTVKAIKKMIMEKKYDEYGYLPSEGELSEQIGVSRATTREAVRTLEVRGFLKRIHGKGIVVVDNGLLVMTRTIRDMLDQQAISLEDVLEVRWIIETKAAELAALKMDEQDLQKLNRLIERMENAKQINEEYLQCDFAFHNQLVACSKNKMLMAIVMAYSQLLNNLIKASTQTTQNIESTYHYHRNIYEALVKHDSQEAREQMERHLTATAQNIMQKEQKY